MTFSSDINNNIKYALDQCYQVPAKLGLHPYQIWLVNVSNAGGARPGVGGTRSRVDTRIYLGSFSASNPGDGYLNPAVKYVSQHDVVLSGNLLNDRDLAIGPLVEDYLIHIPSLDITGGKSIDSLPQPVNTNNNRQYWLIKGPDLFANGIYCRSIYKITYGNLSYRVFVRNSGEIVAP